ncbi:hypothetical protein [Prevotella sp. SGI.167]|uniref:hypothetical protein n=1 Tax=Prevotella sp. SGI.167 TaxID=3420566 RepID=UPI004040C910
MGEKKASDTTNDDVADKLRNLDLLAWDETERYLARFAEDLDDARYAVTDLLIETACLGRTIGMERELPPLTAALTFARLMAAGDEVFEKYQDIWIAIMSSQDRNPEAKPLFEKFCQEIEANKFDPSTGKETIYRRGDPIERFRSTGVAKTDARQEALLYGILEATKGWNRKEAFKACWPLWEELWKYLLEKEELVEEISRKHPKSSSNNTSINITLVCNVAGLLNSHLKTLGHDVASCSRLADLIKENWNSSQSHKELSKTTKLSDEQAKLIKAWLTMNMK